MIHLNRNVLDDLFFCSIFCRIVRIWPVATKLLRIIEDFLTICSSLQLRVLFSSASIEVAEECEYLSRLLFWPCPSGTNHNKIVLKVDQNWGR